MTTALPSYTTSRDVTLAPRAIEFQHPLWYRIAQMEYQDNSDGLVSLSAEIVSAYVSKNSVPASALPSLIGSVYRSLVALRTEQAAAPVEPQKPAVPIKKSVQDDFIICLEDGKKFKSLKRHLGVHYGLTPAAYREKWNLPHDYPMVAPSYACRALCACTEVGTWPQGKGSLAGSCAGEARKEEGHCGLDYRKRGSDRTFFALA